MHSINIMFSILCFCFTNSLSKNNAFIQKLNKIEYKDTKIYYHKFNYCKCIKVYDGDTITVSTILKENGYSDIYRFSVRLMGIDAPEIKSDCVNEILCAKESQKELSKKILNKIIRLEIVKKKDKWGRILANVFLDNENISQWLLDNKLAIPYSGKTKIKDTKWLS